MSKQVESFKVSTTLSAYRVMAINGSNSVAYPTSDAVPFLGVSVDTVLDTNASIEVQISGRAKLYFNDTVSASSYVGSDSSGRGVPFSLPNTTASATLSGQYIGVLIGPAVALTATIAEILVSPGRVRNGL